MPSQLRNCVAGRAAGLMLGMLAGLDRKNCWSIAEHRGDQPWIGETPNRIC